MRLLSLYSSDLKFTKSIHISKSRILAVSKCLDCSGLLENQSYWHKGHNHLIAQDLKKKTKGHGYKIVCNSKVHIRTQDACI